MTAAEKVAMGAGDSQTQVKRFVRLTNLIPEVLDMLMFIYLLPIGILGINRTLSI